MVCALDPYRYLPTRWKEDLEAVRKKASQGLPLLAPSSVIPGSLDLFPDGFDEWIEAKAPSKRLDDGGPNFGLAFHAVMERLDLATGSNLKELCRVKTAEYSIPGSVEKMESICRQCLSHPLMERVRMGERLFREVPFSVSLDGYLVEGKIDLLFQEEEGWVVVDYKTDDVEGKFLERRFQAYQEQGAWYSRGVQRATGQKVKEIIFFFVRPGEIRSVKPEET